MELAFVCQLRLGQPVDALGLDAFFEEYVAEERQDIPNTVVPVELCRCAEWLFEQCNDIAQLPLLSIVSFLEAVGELERSSHTGLKSAWSGRSPE